jgi:polyisoprenoid-binding protein YceI
MSVIDDRYEDPSNSQPPTPNSQGKSRRGVLLGSWKLVIGSSLVAILTAAAVASAAGGTWRATQGDVRVTCPLTIGGSFQAKTMALSGSVTSRASRPPSYDGSLVVDLRTLDTGINLRNEHLRDKYLEVDKAPGYDKATLSEIDLKGLNPDAPEGKDTFTASLMLHGTKKTVTGMAEIHRSGSGFRVKASFPINLPDYGIPEPRYLGVGVKNVVQVEVNFVASPDAAAQLRAPRFVGQATATR